MDYFGFMIFDELHKTIVENGSPGLLKCKKIKNFRELRPWPPAAARSAALRATSLAPYVAMWTRFARPLLQNVLLYTKVVLQPQPVLYWGLTLICK